MANSKIHCPLVQFFRIILQTEHSLVGSIKVGLLVWLRVEEYNFKPFLK